MNRRHGIVSALSRRSCRAAGGSRRPPESRAVCLYFKVYYLPQRCVLAEPSQRTCDVESPRPDDGARKIRRPGPQPPVSEDWGRTPRVGEDGILPYRLSLATILAVKRTSSPASRRARPPETEIPNVNSMKPFTSVLLPIVGRQAEAVDDDMQAPWRHATLRDCEAVCISSKEAAEPLSLLSLCPLPSLVEFVSAFLGRQFVTIVLGRSSSAALISYYVGPGWEGLHRGSAGTITPTWASAHSAKNVRRAFEVRGRQRRRII
ncbi:hypothetical protein THAOC_13706 [Thalassiosira oceanica]|uniref:Uncharacterized protein n=1 Tax=Thalassiosira oceanica TaxID=159749 RepID=K0SWR3_THAOC|nr:hypothetical protein THAOC_13706 [Thalassiosira oceanica]|eukprot:EJK65431.1 hypothetical protein THAOC_13706 [Thalassiosira oceanica]